MQHAAIRRGRPLATLLFAVAVGLIVEGNGGNAVAADKAAINQAVARAAGYLRGKIGSARGGRRILTSYALYKAGSSAESEEVASTVRDILARFDEGAYKPGMPNEAPYQAGVEAMFLADLDPVKYRPQIQAIADYLIEIRLPTNVWDYKGETSPGDTSVTQYGCLGLWAAARVGIDVPIEVWDEIMLWHFRSHRGDGGFTYMPGSTQGPGKGASTLNMTAAAIGSMSIAAMYLYPEQMQKNLGFSGRKQSKPQDPSGLKFGFLEKDRPREAADDAGNGAAGPAIPAKPRGPYKIRTSFAEYKQHTKRALDWLGANFEVHNRVGPAMYYYYALERMGALTNVDRVGPHDWFNLCADFLIDQQQEDGSWKLSLYDRGGPYVIGGSFGILFLTRSTAKLLNRAPTAGPLGGGLLTGGRGLPDDLSHVELDKGRAEARKPSGPLDELLAELAKAGGDGLFEIQEKIVEKIQLGDRSELVGQTDQLVKLLNHPDPQIRRTALWALGRSDDLNLVRYAIRALIDDPDVDVLVEAHNALCWFARRPGGFGLPDNPLDGLPPDASDGQKRAAVEKWRKQAIRAWGKWYVRVCPYKDQDDPFFISLKRRLDRRR